MAATAHEILKSRDLNGESATLRYRIRGTADASDARDALIAAAPSTFEGKARQTTAASVEPITIDENNADACIWEGEVPYGLQNSTPPGTGDSIYNFDTGGGTQHITQSLSTTARYAPGEATAPDFKGAVGVTADSVEGVDIVVPVYHFSETHYKADASVTAGYKATLFALTGTANNATFKGFAAGEVLFLGASGSKRGDDDWEITFRFAASPNVTGLTVGNITGVAKKGWEYMWVRYADTEDTTAKAIVKRPASVHIEKVYNNGDFSGLAI